MIRCQMEHDLHIAQRPFGIVTLEQIDLQELKTTLQRTFKVCPCTAAEIVGHSDLGSSLDERLVRCDPMNDAPPVTNTRRLFQFISAAPCAQSRHPRTNVSLRSRSHAGQAKPLAVGAKRRCRYRECWPLPPWATNTRADTRASRAVMIPTPSGHSSRAERDETRASEFAAPSRRVARLARVAVLATTDFIALVLAGGLAYRSGRCP